jgi:hypothetical protein
MSLLGMLRMQELIVGLCGELCGARLPMDSYSSEYVSGYVHCQQTLCQTLLYVRYTSTSWYTNKGATITTIDTSYIVVYFRSCPKVGLYVYVYFSRVPSVTQKKQKKTEYIQAVQT